MFLKYFLLLLLAAVLLSTTQALKHPSTSDQEVIPTTDVTQGTLPTTIADPNEESKFYRRPFPYKKPYKRPPYKKYPPYKKRPPYKKYPPSSH
ncbi:repetitive proline-rich cell wall protein 3-like [Cucumis melo var. makuwa]|uniref:Repetitive proline-rich cell wall protein 3-like n=2 Tax=Cucumis melo TaxID=3656 RepID=A0A1S3CE34_CUCME|nr:repetitive proline-rich cell wall protein 3-like [Cucumis melo]KAA0065667.1 repetitive proline-rich cell wall protein 3-like [Cucumis melo var. makuwa]TYK15518.1 repetitive proline-rich cell wall protein 3-like [Cucumis melo var. makuwa]